MRSICWRVDWTAVCLLEEWVGKRYGALTGRVVLVGVILAVRWTWPKDAPKGTPDHAFAQTQQVYMVGEGTVFEGLGKVGGVDVVSVGTPQEDGEIVVTI